MDEKVESVLDSYPLQAKQYIECLRALVYEIAEEESLGVVSESLKWGEPSYASSKGSPVRIAWKPKSHDTVSVYFNCQSTLVATFREIYGDALAYSGNREIVLSTAKPLPLDVLKSCLSMALRYHSIKHLPLLGA